MEWYEADVRSLEAKQKSRKVDCPAVFYGSSSIRMWDTLAEDLGLHNLVNTGFGGSTLAACVYFFERLIPPLEPASLVVYAGDNDLGDGGSEEQVLASFRRLILMVELKLKPIPFGFISIKQSPARWNIVDRIRKANEMIRAEIANHPRAYFIDIVAGMLDGAGKPRPEFFLADGLHLSREGYKIWARQLAPYRNRILIEDCRGIHASSLSFRQDETPVSPMVQPKSEP